MVSESVQLEQLAEKVLDRVTKLVDDLAHNDGVYFVNTHEPFVEVFATDGLLAAGLEVLQYFGLVEVLFDPSLILIVNIVPLSSGFQYQLWYRLVEFSLYLDLSLVQLLHILDQLGQLAHVRSQILLLLLKILLYVFLELLLCLLDPLDLVLERTLDRRKVFLVIAH